MTVVRTLPWYIVVVTTLPSVHLTNLRGIQGRSGSDIQSLINSKTRRRISFYLTSGDISFYVGEKRGSTGNSHSVGSSDGHDDGISWSPLEQPSTTTLSALVVALLSVLTNCPEGGTVGGTRCFRGASAAWMRGFGLAAGVILLLCLLDTVDGLGLGVCARKLEY